MRHFQKLLLGGVVFSVLLLPQAGFTQDEGKRQVLDEVKVVGSKESVKDIAASAAFIDTQDIRKQSYDNIDRILRKVPGVYTREEDGFGLFPNISIRGVDPARSAKVTIMEDGILTAPAPYSAPAAYYSPTAGRMSGIEVLKGSSQVRYGPHTTGGVINYLSTAIPDSEQYYSKVVFGSFGEARNHTYFGNTIETGSGRFGFVIENYFRRNKGFRDIQTTADFRNGDDTGFENTEPMIKLAFEPNTSMYQRFEAKFGYTERDANESYLGQTESDFRNNPFRRLAATRFDTIDTEHFRSYIRHFIELDDRTNLVTTAYGNTFFRNWQKLHQCRSGGGGLGSNLSLSQCLEDPVGSAILKGAGPGVWRLRNNNRKYYLYGVQSNLTHDLALGATEHKINVGARYHYDQIRRFQWNEDYTQDANGAIISRVDGVPGTAGNRRQRTKALAFNAEDQIKYRQWTFKPGVRYEQIWQHFNDLSSGVNRRATYGVWAAGGSVDYRFNESTNSFFGINRGFSVPNPSGATKTGAAQVEEETSISYEVGTRYNKPEIGFSAELIGFWTDIDDMVVADIIGGAGAGQTRNIGKVRTRGIEFQTTYDPSIQQGWSFRNPWYFTMTYTNAEFRSTVGSGDPESIFSGATNGDEVPNIPEIQFAVGTSLVFNKFTLNVDGQYIDSTFATGDNATNNFNLVAGAADSRFGKTDSVFLLDASLSYKINPKVNLFTNFRNITDETYLAGRVPHGPRAGAPFQMFGGVEINF
ncbi:TonB-dependent receptor [candidate division KSB1 bacterium]|nr:TonB-dependent receptor [candidate division KSB1 bacterium]NIV94504.1 TonB-dependent receptor [candidate division KSB1 bacterium]NIW69702.1 TonB-dependent receptor [candidate division KSB1 bacterium]